MSEVSVETLKNLLKTDVVSVTFTKVNGDKRVLKCTLQETYLPEYNSDSTRKKSDNVISVWDIESQEWRSFISWSTYEKEFVPPYYPLALERAICVNPISWERNETYVPKTQHKGAALRPFELALPQICDAQVHGGILWVTKPKFKGSWLWRDKNYHMGDINLFYFDIRENAALRMKQYMLQN